MSLEKTCRVRGSNGVDSSEELEVAKQSQEEIKGSGMDLQSGEFASDSQKSLHVQNDEYRNFSSGERAGGNTEITDQEKLQSKRQPKLVEQENNYSFSNNPLSEDPQTVPKLDTSLDDAVVEGGQIHNTRDVNTKKDQLLQEDNGVLVNKVGGQTIGKLEVIKEGVAVTNSENGYSSGRTSVNTSFDETNAVVLHGDDDDLSRQRKALDFGFYEPTTGKPRRVSSEGCLRKVEFYLGEDDGVLPADTYSGGNDKSKKGNWPSCVDRETEGGVYLSGNKSAGSQYPPHHGLRSYDEERGGFVKSPVRKKPFLHLERISSSPDNGLTTTTQNSSQNQLRLSPPTRENATVTFGNGNLNSSAYTNARNGTGGGILKKPFSQVSLTHSSSERNMERDTSSTNTSDGLRRYRRRSQNMLSPDIPTDIPLKQRQIENDRRIMDNLQFLKRRVSLQEGEPTQPGASTRRLSGHRRSQSSCDYIPDREPNNNQPAVGSRKKSRDMHPYRVNHGFTADEEYLQSAPPTTRKLSGVHNGVSFGNAATFRNSRNYRRQSQDSLGDDVFAYGYTDEDIDECLGNIPSHLRQYGMPPTPQNVSISSGKPEAFPSYPAPPASETSYLSDNGGSHRAAGYRSSLEDTMDQPYVPIRKQRCVSVTENAFLNNDSFHRSSEPNAPRRSSRASTSSLQSMDSDSLSSWVDTNPWSRLRKDSLALFNPKLAPGGPGRLRRFSQASLAELEQLKQKHKELTKTEILKQYRLHIFVGTIFIITVLSVSLSWHFRNKIMDDLHSSQAIFFNPRTREITLTDPSRTVTVSGSLGLGIPRWQLPLHCPMVASENPHFKECTWRKTATLRIQEYDNGDVQCYNISWESLNSQHVPYDCYNIRDDLWYGPSNQSSSISPIRGKFEFNPRKYILGNNGVFGSVVDFYWVSSSGTAFYVSGDNPIRIHWNSSGDNKLCLMSNYSGPLYPQRDTSSSFAQLNYTVCSGFDILKTHLSMQSEIAPVDPEITPPLEVFRGPHWSVKSVSQTDNVTQEDIMDLVENITQHGFQGSIITIDGNWQGMHGDLLFDETRFPNLTQLVDDLQAYDTHLTLSVSPYFQYNSQNFHHGIVNSMFVKDAGGDVAGLTSYKGGFSAVIDVFSEDGMDWYEKKLEEVLTMSGTTFVRLTYGDQAWLPYKPHFQSAAATPNSYRRKLTERIRKVSKALIVEHTSDSRHISSLIPLTTDIDVTNNKMCLQGLIEKALTLGLMGYPYIMADGFRITSKAAENNDLESDLPSRELYIRWLQLATFFPAYQFSVAPWSYDEGVVTLARNLSAQHEKLVVPEITSETMIEEIKRGLPILRPVWWLNPTNRSLHESELVKSEFLIGDQLLVAPVLCEGATSRAIYFPPGVWEDLRHVKVVLGPKTLTNYPVPLGEVAVFRRKTVVGETTTEL